MPRAALVATVMVLATSAPAYGAPPPDAPVSGAVDVVLFPPAPGPIARRFEPPRVRWGPGHRGIDFAVAAGTPLQAPARGTVTFAGRAAGVLAISIDHGGGVTSTLSSLAGVEVEEGVSVARGEVVGVSGVAHVGGPAGVHLGVKVDGRYADPAGFLGALDGTSAIHLAPVVSPLADRLPTVFAGVPRAAGSHEEGCIERVSLRAVPRDPPNDNVVVAVAGIGSRTEGGTGAGLYEDGPEQLGYPESLVYRFSYRGIDGERFHAPYPSSATFAPIRTSAHRLGDLLRGIARRHPERDVDIVAHSQGGVVARAFLALHADDPGMPRIEHFVTLASPHDGAALAGAARDLQSSPVGRLLLSSATRLARAGIPVPDPGSPAVRDLAPGSDLLEAIAGRDRRLGVRSSGLGIVHDLVVPASSTALDGGENHVLGPEGWNGHGVIVGSPEALGLVHNVLRDGPPACPDGWDPWGPVLGRAVAWLEGSLGRLLGRLGT